MPSPPTPWRAIQTGLAATLLVLGSPLMIGISISIWLDDGFPIFFKQIRAGKKGQPFSIFKFRTLQTEGDSTTPPSEDATRTGKYLRRWALDELPQLLNVMRAEMNIVGPRPVLLSEVRGYDDRAMQRLDVRPGITGWAQVRGRNSLTWAERLELDLWYVRNRSLLLDLWIIAKTPVVLFIGQGVYGPGTEDPTPSEVRSHLSANDV